MFVKEITATVSSPTHTHIHKHRGIPRMPPSHIFEFKSTEMLSIMWHKKKIFIYDEKRKLEKVEAVFCPRPRPRLTKSMKFEKCELQI